MKDTKKHIQNVSFRLFLKKSFKEVTMKEIVEKTGMSKGAFYHYYDSKEQIFLEIINSTFSSFLYTDYSKLSQNSLCDFYHDYIHYLNRMYENFQEVNGQDTDFDMNYYSLIFDAMRIFPHFRDKMIQSSKDELEAWTHIIRDARASGEIRSPMTDEQIAGIFIHTISGIGMSNMIAVQNEETTQSLLNLWDAFYAQLKA